MSQANNIQTQIQLTQILFNSAVFTGIGASKDYLRVSESQYNAKLIDVVMNIKTTFYGILYTKELLNIVNISYQNAQENLTNVDHLYREGLVSEFTQLDASVRVENIKPQIKQLENTVATATNGLKILLGISQAENINISGGIEYVDEDLQEVGGLVSKAQSNNLTIKTLEQVINVNQASVDVSSSDYYPSLAFFANYGINAMSNNFSNFNSFPTSNIGLSFSMNLFKGMQTKYQVQEAKIDLTKTQEQILQLKEAIAMQVRNNINELQRIKEDIAAQDRNISVAERAYSLATTRFKEGTGSQLEIMNSDVSLKQAKTNRLESVYNYLNAKAKLDNILGIINPAWLK
jgi:outer membrane protein TolC